MGFTKRELVGFFDSLTDLVSEENRKEAEFLIRTFMEGFEKSYPYETASYMGKETVSFSARHVAALPESIQQEIREEVFCRTGKQWRRGSDDGETEHYQTLPAPEHAE